MDAARGDVARPSAEYQIRHVRLSFPDTFRRLFQTKRDSSADVPAPGVASLEGLFLQWPLLKLSSGTPLEESRPGLWTIDTASGLPVFTFLTGDALQVDTVVFPAPEDRIGLRGLWYWHSRQVQTFWFCELDGWRRKDAQATFVRHVYRRTVRRCLAVLPRFLVPSHYGMQEALVKGMLAWRGRSESDEVWDRTSEGSGQSLWMERIRRDNDTFLSDEDVQPDHRSRTIHYTNSLSASNSTCPVLELSSQEAKRGDVVEVLTSEPARPDHSSAAAQLAANDIPCRPAKGTGLSVRLSHEVDWDLLRSAPPGVRERAFDLTAALLQEWPDVLHCWGRSTNLVGAIAGFTVGVPRILVHFDKDHRFEALDQEVSGLSAWYAILSHSKRMRYLTDECSASSAWKSWIQAFRGLDHFGLDDGAASK